MFFLWPLIPFFYLLFRLVLPARMGAGAKVLCALFLLIVTQAFAINRFLLGDLAAPDLPPWLLMVQGWLFAAAILLFVLVLLRDVILLLRGLWRLLFRRKGAAQAAGTGSPASPSRRELVRAGCGGLLLARPAERIALACAVLGPTAFGVSQAVAVPALREEEARLRRLAPEHEGLRVAQISDLHMSSLLTRDWVAAVVDRVNAQKPDLIALTGDMVDGPPERRMESARELSRLKAPLGVFACVGNHEYYSGYAAWVRVFGELGLHMLLNGHAVLTPGGKELVLAGLTDPVARAFGLPGPDMEAAMAGAPAHAPCILLEHRPGYAPLRARQGVDFQLSGHTHGGQAPGLREIVSSFNNGYVRGWFDVDGMPLYVSPGAGLWGGFPIRIATPSEIAVFTLRRAEA
ncbi:MULTISPECIES: metallophosphoesterase [unclassified Desulfovibrio]|uniref:metallophosphoesterase n=1 Tax=unclassified Desulfovibrio TaxID=2593640 RepID=UPI0013EAE4BA|nr:MULTISPECIES: metallophosphoesterase [unclassified Desulfovibrio]